MNRFTLTHCAAIMGVGYYKPLVQFSKGEYAGASNHEDGFIATQNFGMLLGIDDYGSSIASAMPVVQVNTGGIISGTMDNSGNALVSTNPCNGLSAVLYFTVLAPGHLLPPGEGRWPERPPPPHHQRRLELSHHRQPSPVGRFHRAQRQRSGCCHYRLEGLCLQRSILPHRAGLPLRLKRGVAVADAWHPPA